MLLCRVALGKVGLYRSSDIAGYDSMIGGTAVEKWRRFYEFVISEERQIYPAYVIYYDRMPGSLAKFKTNINKNDDNCTLL